MVLGGALFDERTDFERPFRGETRRHRSPEDNARRRKRLIKIEPRAPSDAKVIHVEIV